MAETLKLLKCVLLSDLARLAYAYFASIEEDDWYDIGSYGIWELATKVTRYDVNELLAGACYGGHIAIAQIAISNGANGWNRGLYNAASSGELGLVKLMVEHGANNWNEGLWWACRNNHTEVVQYMIWCGATECCCVKNLTCHVQNLNMG
jgi:hypothetical protein